MDFTASLGNPLVRFKKVCAPFVWANVSTPTTNVWWDRAGWTSGGGKTHLACRNVNKKWYENIPTFRRWATLLGNRWAGQHPFRPVRPSVLPSVAKLGRFVCITCPECGRFVDLFFRLSGRKVICFVCCFGVEKVKTLYELLRSCWVSFHGISQINSTFYQIDWHLKLFRDFGRCLGIATEMRCFSSNLCLCSKVFDELGYINKKADSNIAQINKARRSHGWLNISMIFEFIRHVIVLLTKHCFTRKVNIKFARLYNASIE